MSAPPLRVVQVGLGPIGQAVARLAAAHPGMRLVGAADPGPSLCRRDLGEILGLEPSGRVVAGSIAEALDAARPDLALHATGSHLDAVAPQLRSCLERGIAVVSTCEELSYPFYRHPELSRELDACASAHGAVLLGTGVNPGFVLDKLVATLLTACLRVERVRAVRVLDAARRRRPFVAKVGAGITPEEFEARRSKGEIGHVGLAESAHLVADVMGVPRERVVHERVEPRLAERDVVAHGVEVARGRVLGVHQVAVLEADDRERVRLELELAVGAEDPRDAVVVEGEPRLEMTLAGGVPGDEATAAVTVNSAGRIRDLAPGLRTMLDVPVRFDLARP